MLRLNCSDEFRASVEAGHRRVVVLSEPAPAASSVELASPSGSSMAACTGTLRGAAKRGKVRMRGWILVINA